MQPATENIGGRFSFVQYVEEVPEDEEIHAFAVLALVGLTVTGVVYAAWSQSITVDGTVETGTFDIVGLSR